MHLSEEIQSGWKLQHGDIPENHHPTLHGLKLLLWQSFPIHRHLSFPGRNQEILKIRRDDLLKKLYEREYIDSLTLVLSLDEPLPGEPKPLPSKAPHLTDYFFINNRGADDQDNY